MYDYHGNLERVVDGDTVRMTLDHGMYIRSSQSIRLLAVFAPEMSETFGPAAKSFVAEWFKIHTHTASGNVWPFFVMTEKDKQTFNRYVGIIGCRYCQAQLNLAVREYLEATPEPEITP